MLWLSHSQGREAEKEKRVDGKVKMLEEEVELRRQESSKRFRA